MDNSLSGYLNWTLGRVSLSLGRDVFKLSRVCGLLILLVKISKVEISCPRLVIYLWRNGLCSILPWEELATRASWGRGIWGHCAFLVPTPAVWGLQRGRHGPQLAVPSGMLRLAPESASCVCMISSIIWFQNVCSLMLLEELTLTLPSHLIGPRTLAPC